jgi:sugar-specific transcriptional regulator TrmB
MDAKKPELVALLGDLGFTENEGKAYLALLREQPLTGYGVARASGVPRSKVYGVLEGMVEAGVALVSRGDPTRYAPLPPEELVAARRREAEATLSAAEDGLKGYVQDAAGPGLIFDLAGRQEIFGRSREAIGRAQERLLLELWRDDAAELGDALKAAAERGVEVVVVAYGDPGYGTFATVYLHEPGAERIAREYGGRWVVLSVDGREIVTGSVHPEETSRAAWSSHPGMVVPATELITHDLYIAEMLAAHRETLEESFGPSLERLRRRFAPPPGAYLRRTARDA